MCIPCGRNVPCRHPAAVARLTQSVRTFVTIGSVDSVTSFIRIGGVSKECCAARVAVAHGIIVCTIFLSHLEHAIVVVGNFTHAVLHTPTAPPSRVTVVRVGFQTTIEVYNVDIVVNIVILCRCTEVPTEHTVVGAVEDTSIRKY